MQTFGAYILKIGTGPFFWPNLKIFKIGFVGTLATLCPWVPHRSEDKGK